jgi:zinc protease
LTVSRLSGYTRHKIEKIDKWEVPLGFKKRAAIASVLLSLTVVLGGPGAGLGNGAGRFQNSPFVLPIVKRDSLLNGLHLITLERPGAASVGVHLRINTGALFDLAGKGGLGDLTAGMLLKGGGGLSSKAVSETVEQLALSVSVRVGWDSTDIVVSGAADSLDSIFDLLGKLLIAPAFDQREFDLLKSARVATLKAEAQDDAIAVRRKAIDAVFGTFPYGRPPRGTAESIAQISRQDLLYFHSRFYIANNSELVVTGNTTAEQVTRLARSKLGAWKKGEKIPPTFKPSEPQPSRRVFILDRSEEQPPLAAVAQIGVSRRAPDYFAAAIMADCLNQQIPRAPVNAGTSVQTELDARLLAGPLIVELKSASGNLASDLDAVLETMTRMQASRPAADQVEAAKTRLISSMSQRLNAPETAAEVILDIETYGLGRDYVINFAERVNAIGPADVQRSAQSYLKPQSLTVVIAGPASRFEIPLKKIGTVAVVK